MSCTPGRFWTNNYDDIMMNKRGPNRRPRSSLPCAPARLLGFPRTILSLSTALCRPSFPWGGYSGQASPLISMGTWVSVRVVPNMEALPCLQIDRAVVSSLADRSQLFCLALALALVTVCYVCSVFNITVCWKFGIR